MWYITVIFFLSIFSFIEMANRDRDMTPAFKYLWLVLTLMLMFRYGQGTDYYEYYLQYDFIDSTGSFFVNALAHGEIGWYMLMLLAKKIGLSFFVYIGLISLVMMISVYRFICMYSKGRIISLLLLFPSYYLTYFYSAMRQGLVIALFLGFGVKLLCDRKYLYYYIFIALLTLLHTSAIVLLLLPFAINCRIKRIFVVIGVVLLFAFVTFFARNYVSIGYDEGAGVLGIVIRLFLLYFAWLIYASYPDDKNADDNPIGLLFRIYFTGFIIFFIFSASGTLSQRISAPFKAVEIVLFPSLLLGLREKMYVMKTQHVVITVFYAVLLVFNVEFVKNIYSYIDQGNYREWVTPLDYPYITVFEQDDIYKYITNFDDEE